ncbi:MAG: hypothetical protein KatS3mg057_3174 [Herpetosiphonaceae bacterium]|nr:MAG: hypothetical protein KatS3mg057_3174 [Herpetosiphonaceae bacterium]
MFEQECLQIAREIGDQMFTGYALTNLAVASFMLSDAEVSERYLQEALALFESTGYRMGLQLCLFYLGTLACEPGDYATSTEHFDRALKVAVDIQAIPEVLSILIGIADRLVRQGATEEAIQLAAVVLSHPASYQLTKQGAENLLAQLRAELSPEVVAAAYERGSARAFEEVVAALLER